MLEQWKILSREKVFSTPVFDVYKNVSVSPRTGRGSDFFVLVYPRAWVNVVAVTTDEKIVMIRQYRHGTESFELEIPGGLAEKGEDIVATAVRELKEETGFTGSDARLIGKVSPNPALQGNWCYTVLVDNAELSSDLELDENEDIETLLVPVAEVEKQVIDGTITHGLILNALSFYFFHRNRK